MTKENATLIDYLKLSIVYGLPQHAISSLVYKLTRVESSLVPAAIRMFSKQFNVDLSEAIHSDPTYYKTFNAFFTREIKPELRPINQDNNTIISPVDGTISQIGDIDKEQIFQAKGHHYSVNDLLGNHESLSKPFQNGKFATIYLSPRDYHRIHCPFNAQLTNQIYIPGRLYSVAPFTVKTLKGIFARNERVVTLFDTDIGKMAVILVGAINVASIETVWHGAVTPSHKRQIDQKSYADGIQLNKGSELGRFNMGSTVILLFENPNIHWAPNLATNDALLMGQHLGNL